MRIAMRVLCALAVPGVLFAWLTQVSGFWIERELDAGFFPSVAHPSMTPTDVLLGAVGVAMLAVIVVVLVRSGASAPPRRRRQAP